MLSDVMAGERVLLQVIRVNIPIGFSVVVTAGLVEFVYTSRLS